MSDNFSFVMPADIVKSEDGEWKVAGLASTQGMDQQGETIIQKGIDLSPIDQQKGYFNFDHLKGPENLIGTIDGYQQSEKGLYVHGKLFKNHDKAKSVYQIMSSLSKNDRGRVGLSVEGQILERDKANPRVIKKCRINKVAITLNPVNSDTYADLVKSMSNDADIEFNSTESSFDSEVSTKESTFTATQVLDIVQKALSVGGSMAPDARTGGDALVTESLKKDKKKKKDPCWDGYERTPGTKQGAKGSCRPKKMSKSLIKSNLIEILDKLQVLYPDNSRSELWSAVKDRLNTKYDDLIDNI